MGYDVPIFSGIEKELDKDVQYQLSDDKRELTVTLPYATEEKYDVQYSDPNSLVLRESRESDSTYILVFTHEGTSNRQIRHLGRAQWQGDLITEDSGWIPARSLGYVCPAIRDSDRHF